MKSNLNLATIIFAAILILNACKNKEAETAVEETSQMESVMATHDEIMPYMSEIGQLIRQLEEGMDSTQDDDARMGVIADLKSANEDMMTWMMEFGDDFDSEEVLDGKPLNEDKTQKLIAYEKSIDQLREDMQQSMKKAKSYLEGQN